MYSLSCVYAHGLEDFARTNVNYIVFERYRFCLFFIMKRTKKEGEKKKKKDKNNQTHHLDSECHVIFFCPMTNIPRREFILLTELECFFERSSSVETLALLVGRAREDRKLVNRHLSSDAGKKSPATKLEFFRPLTSSS